MPPATPTIPLCGLTRTMAEKIPEKIRRYNSINSADQSENLSLPFSTKSKSVRKSVSAPILSSMFDIKLKTFFAEKRERFRQSLRSYRRLRVEKIDISEPMDIDVHEVKVVDVETQVRLCRMFYIVHPFV